VIPRFPELLAPLAESYHRRLNEVDLCNRMAHHFAHVASESWLCQELAYLVNTDQVPSLVGWTALLERRRVDVTLVPPKCETELEPTYLELKFVLPENWGNWHEVYRDLGCHPLHTVISDKPKGHFAICFLIDALSTGSGSRRAVTIQNYREMLDRIPIAPGVFQPLGGMPQLQLVYRSPSIALSWPNQVGDRWPDGYKANVSLLWVATHG
jgi:hypothetical protein